MKMQRTLVLIKPDALERGLIGKIITRFEDKGLRILGLKMLQMDKDMLAEHYAHLNQQVFFSDVIKFMMSAPVVALCVEGLDAVNVVRSMCGITKSREAEPGTIRGDLGMSIRSNLVHASDNSENAILEINRIFGPEEIFIHTKILDQIIYIDKQI